LHDLVVRGGRVIDPARNIDAMLDVAVDGARIAAVGPDLAAQGARQLIDAAGLIVTPGLVDIHTHVFWGVPPLGIEPDPHCLARGVTTAVDAGSAGASTFPAFRRYIIEVSATRIVAMLHISSIGMARDDGGPHEAVGELEDIRWARVDRAIDVARANADLIVGIKVRLSTAMVGEDPDQCREAMRRTREAADAIGKPAMVHIGGTNVSIAARACSTTMVRCAARSDRRSIAACCSTSATAPAASTSTSRVGRSIRGWRRARSAPTSTPGAWPARPTTWRRPPASSCISVCRWAT
jgi:predicted amidohydrolase